MQRVSVLTPYNVAVTQNIVAMLKKDDGVTSVTTFNEEVGSRWLVSRSQFSPPPWTARSAEAASFLYQPSCRDCRRGRTSDGKAGIMSNLACCGIVASCRIGDAGHRREQN